MLENNGERMSEGILILILLVCFLAHKLRWKDSTLLFSMSGVTALGSLSNVFVFLGPEPKVPVFLVVYSLTAITCLVWGLKDLSRERAALSPFLEGKRVVPDWRNGGPGTE